MVDSLPGTDDTPLGPRAFAAAQRQTAIGLAAIALTAAGGDEDTAKTILRGPLEAIGLLPYEPGTGKYHWGQQ